MAKATSLAELLKSKPPTRVGSRTWFEKLPHAQAKLLEFREQYRAGQFDGYSKSDMFAVCKATYGFTIELNAFSRWLNEKPHG